MRDRDLPIHSIPIILGCTQKSPERPCGQIGIPVAEGMHGCRAIPIEGLTIYIQRFNFPHILKVPLRGIDPASDQIKCIKPHSIPFRFNPGQAWHPVITDNVSSIRIFAANPPIDYLMTGYLVRLPSDTLLCPTYDQ